MKHIQICSKGSKFETAKSVGYTNYHFKKAVFIMAVILFSFNGLPKRYELLSNWNTDQTACNFFMLQLKSGRVENNV